MAILDDYFGTLRTLPWFTNLEGQQITFWNDDEDDVDVLAVRLRHTEALVLIRERERVTMALLDRLDHLRLISQRTIYLHIDVEVCTRLGALAPLVPARG